MIEYVPKSLQYADLYLNQYGIEPCSPCHFHGPAVRDHYLIHYILDGQGTFEVGDQTYTLSSGQGFLICPGVVTYYQADEVQPWHYCWVGFHGLHAESYLLQAGLTKENPIFRYDRDDALIHLFGQMIAAKKLNKAGELKLIGLLYMLLSTLVEAAPKEWKAGKRTEKREAYVKKVIDFIDMNYSSSFTITQIADFVGLDRSYLCSIFKGKMNSSIQEYLIHFRINKACELMENSELSIGDVSRSVGYDDPLLFSKIFRKTKGVPPREYRNLNHQ